MSLKIKFYSLTYVLHSVLLIAAYFYLSEDKLEFVFVELFIITSLILFLRLVKKVLAPFQFVDLFSDVLSEKEFTTRFSHTGNKELDNLMTLFNQMLNELYEERIRLGDRKGMLQQLMDAIPLGIVVFDYNSKVTQLNPAAEKLFSIESNSVKGNPLTYIVHPIIEQLNLLPENQSQLLSDNTGRRFRCSRSVFRDRGFERNFLIIQEMTIELQSSERKTYEKLIRMMSHEVNNTMAATSSLLKSCLVYSDQIEDSEREDYRTAMLLVIQRTDNLNQFMQEYSQLVKLPKPSLESCNLQHLLLSIKRLYEAELEQKNIDFVLPKITDDEMLVQADQKQLEQVLINVVTNAMESISNKEKKGQISIELIKQTSQLILRINDSGEGISNESKHNIFTPFFTTKSDGQGIGLMLTREILDAHQFDFSLYNRKEKGACFEINFKTPEPRRMGRGTKPIENSLTSP